MYPRIVVDSVKLSQNASCIFNRCKKAGIKVFSVTKSFCAHPDVTEIILKSGIEGVADSRIQNLKKLKDFNVEKCLLRLPMMSEIEEVVKYSDISLNSEKATLKALNEEAKKQNKIHQVILMVDLGDLREGILPKDVDEYVDFIESLDAVLLQGLGVNLTCYGAVIPTAENLGELCDLANQIESKLNRPLKWISGGNSSSYYLLDKGLMPSKINQLRIGESIVLGRETAYGEKIEGTHEDVFTFEAQIVELKIKGSLPKGEIGMDAFGQVPSYEDRGEIKRAILAVGQQDVDAKSLRPIDEKIDILGSSSDHMILDVTQSDHDYQVGDVVQFKVEYGSLLSLFTSEYIEKVIKNL